MNRRILSVAFALSWLFFAASCSGESKPAPPPVDVGMRLVYEVREDADPGELTEVVRARLSGWAEGKAVVLPESDARHPHVGVARGLPPDDLDRVRRLVASPGRFEMWVLVPSGVEEAEQRRRDRLGPDYSPSEGVLWVPQMPAASPEGTLVPSGRDRLVDASEECFTEADLDPDSLRAEEGVFGPGWVVKAAMREERRDAFGEFTERILGRELALIRDGRLVSAPIVQDRLQGGFQISGGGYGGFTRAEAEDFVTILRSGPLPAELVLVAEEAIPPKRPRPASPPTTCMNNLKQIGSFLVMHDAAHDLKTAKGGRAFLLQVVDDLPNADLKILLCPGGPERDVLLLESSEIVDWFRGERERAPCGYRGPDAESLARSLERGSEPVLWACCRNGFAGTDPYHPDGVCVLSNTGRVEFVTWGEMEGYEGGPVRVGPGSPDPRFRHLVD